MRAQSVSVVGIVMLVLILLVLIGCGEEAAIGLPDDGLDAPGRRNVSTKPSSDSGAPPIIEEIDVRGVLTNDRDVPLAERRVVLLDAHGWRREAITDGAGELEIRGVTPPYDLAITGAPANAPTTVMLGLRRADPYIELAERSDTRRAMTRGQTIRVGVRAPCRACTVTVVTASPRGSGRTTERFGLSSSMDGVMLLDINHGWRTPTVPDTERIDVHVLVTDAEVTSFAYARMSGLGIAPGARLDVGTIEPSPVGSTPLRKYGVRPEMLAGWEWSTEVELELGAETTFAGGAQAIGMSAGTPARFVFRTASESSVVTRVPLIPGALTRTMVTADHPHSQNGGGFQLSTHAWSGVEPVVSPPGLIDVDFGPTMMRPMVDGLLSRHGEGFAWRASTGQPTLSTLTIADLAHGSVPYRILTMDEAVRVGRLERLGLPKLLLGNHALELATKAGFSLDDLTSPDSTVRRRPHDRVRAGTETELHVPFQVVR